MELSWWEWELLRLTVLLITAPAVVLAVYLIFRERGPYSSSPGDWVRRRLEDLLALLWSDLCRMLDRNFGERSLLGRWVNKVGRVSDLYA